MWQVVNAAWDKGLLIGGENAITCFDREGCMRLIEMAKPRNHPDSYHFSFFTYRQPSPLVQGSTCFADLDYFIKRMHGEVYMHLQSIAHVYIAKLLFLRFIVCFCR